MNYLLIIIGLLPSFAWLTFYLEEDPHPEPKKLIFYTFLAGAASTFIVLGLQLLFSNWLAAKNLNQFAFLPMLVLAGIEELFKFLAAYLVVSNNRKEFNEPIDAMIYMVVAALGFAAVENIAVVFKSGVPSIETASLRFIGATLLHSISSGLLGYYWARSLSHYEIGQKIRLALVGFLAATLLHTIFNFLIIISEPLVAPTIFLIIFALFILYDFEKLKRCKQTDNKININ
ncbi:MAG: hypothetical protein Athens101426_216 [Parcubacteria group bacterium Athens1014_26]|nr:MAG: hypothetical protein Athens101426_216 [Parcubacteria group bacterium Athens1014_26]